MNLEPPLLLKSFVKPSLLLVALILAACAQTAKVVPTENIVVTETVTISSTPDKPIGTEKQSDSDGMTQLYIPDGKFQMGTSTEGDWTGEDEFPLHEVFLNSFWMDRTEVTNAQYQKCVQAGNCTPPHALGSETHKSYFDNSEFANYPVIQVDWDQANAYCQWAGRRLPSEAEWEKAARGSEERVYPWEGEFYGSDFANFDRNNGQNSDTIQVDSISLGASPYGILHMAGNVYEWVADRYSADYYKDSPAENPTGPGQGIARVIRGGAWTSDLFFIRTASRLSYYPDGHSNDIGFRCAQSN